MKHYTTARFSFEDKALDIVYQSLFMDLLGNNDSEGQISKISSHRKHTTILEFGNILHEALKKPENSDLGIQYGAYLNIAAAGTLGQLIMSCNDIGQAFDRLLTYCQLLSLSLDVTINEEGDQTSVFLERIYCKRMPPIMHRFLTESVLSCWLHQARWLSGKELTFKQLHIAYPRPDNWQLYEQTFGCEVEFSCGYHCIVVDDDFIQSKIPSQCKTIRQLKERDCSEFLRRLEKKIPLRERIFTMLSRTSPEVPDMDSIAEKLHLSRSTLYRKLNNSDTSYQQIVDDFRCKLAVNYLETTAMTLHEIADEMGFSDASNFRRAFKKWTGVAPSSIRQGLSSPLPRNACVFQQNNDTTHLPDMQAVR